MAPNPHPRARRDALAVAAAALLAACADVSPTVPVTPSLAVSVPCTANVRTQQVSCAAGGLAGDARGNVFGGQNVNVRLTSSNVAYTAADSVFAFDVAVTNLLPEALGTVDGITLDSAGIRVFFDTGPSPTAGFGGVAVGNASGTRAFTRVDQSYFQYNQVLARNTTSTPLRWRLKVAPTVDSFGFSLLVSTETERRVVINEVMPNPGGTVQDSLGEYVELSNAGRLPARLRGFILRDNTAGAADTIKSELVVAPGGYALLGRSANTARNGGFTPDYLYTSRVGTISTAFQFSNSGSDFFVVRAPTGITVDSVFYASGSITAVAGVARELRDPALDNTLMDGANWGAATPFYDNPAANRGTPGAANSIFVP